MDTRQLRRFQRALSAASSTASHAVTVAWRERRRAADLKEAMNALRLGDGPVREALQREIDDLISEAWQREVAADRHRARIAELRELLGGSR